MKADSLMESNLELCGKVLEPEKIEDYVLQVSKSMKKFSDAKGVKADSNSIKVPYPDYRLVQYHPLRCRTSR